MAGKQIIPAVIKYTTELAESLGKVKSACPEADTSVQTELLTETSALLSDIKVALAALADIVEECEGMESGSDPGSRLPRQGCSGNGCSACTG